MVWDWDPVDSAYTAEVSMEGWEGDGGEGVLRGPSILWILW
jgi:hypothetical protein